MQKAGAPENIDAYIERFPDKVQKLLQRIRKTIQKAAPDATEAISYQMPAFKQKRVLVYFAAYTNHIAIYPAPRGAKEFKQELAQYEGGKGTVQFPLDQPVPYDLITRIVKYRIRENAELDSKRVAAAKKKR
ncbi:MAG TPA: DUF1801 domain-containing protein [Pyrinomonadaceae bacterium]|nr:DUF1801 domain-containing protein [Pyrinomonadaceae bacterium]